MSEAADHLAANLFEAELRQQGEDNSRNAWELLWLLGLPVDVRRSYYRIQEARINQDAARHYLFWQSFYRHRDWREPCSPEELDCMVIEPVRPWASIGRRVQRRKAVTGRASTRRTPKPKQPPIQTGRPTRPTQTPPFRRSLQQYGQPRRPKLVTPAMPTVQATPVAFRLVPFVHVAPDAPAVSAVSIAPDFRAFPAVPVISVIHAMPTVPAAPVTSKSIPSVPVTPLAPAAPVVPVTDPDVVPPRCITPAGLREALCRTPSMLLWANGINPVTLDGSFN
jgi:hypothetical protein